jgi:hypothetical protein
MDEPKPGPKLDLRIANMMGKRWRTPTHGYCCTCQTCGWDHDNCQCGYSTEIEMAFRVVEKFVADGFFVAVESPAGPADKTWRASFSEPVPHPTAWSADCSTAPHAICLAALRVVGKTP